MKVYRTSREVRERYGNCSDMTLYRWLHDPEIAFPQPIRLAGTNGPRLWDEEALDDFDRRRTGSGKRAA